MNFDYFFANTCYSALFLSFSLSSLFLKFHSSIVSCSNQNVLLIHLTNLFFMIIFFTLHSLTSRNYVKHFIEKRFNKKVERALNASTAIIFLILFLYKWRTPCSTFTLVQFGQNSCVFFNFMWLICQFLLYYFIYKARMQNSYNYFDNDDSFEKCPINDAHPIFLFWCLSLWFCDCNFSMARIIMNTCFSIYCLIGSFDVAK